MEEVISGVEADQMVALVDKRAEAPSSDIHYKNLHNFRVEQMKLGILDPSLTDTQWGLVPLDRCHHISITASSKDGPQSYRVRICKTCCQENCHIELGTYADQESAILVNDAFEIMSNRLDKLLVLTPADGQYLHLLTAKKVDRTKGKETISVLELLSERSPTVPLFDSRKRKSPSASLDGSARKVRVSTESVTSESDVTESVDRRIFPVEVTSDSDDTTTNKSQTSSQSSASKRAVNFSDVTAPLPSTTAATTSSTALVDQVIPSQQSSTPNYARMRSFTFSTAADYSPNNRFNSFYQQLHQNKTPIDTLTWLASLEDDEVDVAKSLFSLKAVSSVKEEAQDEEGKTEAADEGNIAEKLLMLSSSAKKELLSTPGTGRTEEEDVEDDYDESSEVFADNEGEEGLYDYHSDPEEGEAHRLHALMVPTGRVAAINENIAANNIRGRRGRANSMSVLERPILGLLPASLQLNCPPGSPNSRSKGKRTSHSARRERKKERANYGWVCGVIDPLAIVLKKFAERGSIPGKGYIGEYI